MAKALAADRQLAVLAENALHDVFRGRAAAVVFRAAQELDVVGPRQPQLPGGEGLVVGQLLAGRVELVVLVEEVLQAEGLRSSHRPPEEEKLPRRRAAQWPLPLDLAPLPDLRHAGVDAGAAETNQRLHAVLRGRLGKGAQRGAVQRAPRQRRVGAAALSDRLVVNARQRVWAARPAKASGDGLQVLGVLRLEMSG